MEPILLIVPLLPKGKERPRATIIGGKHSKARVHVFTPTPTANWEKACRQLIADSMPAYGLLLQPLQVDILAVAARPPRMTRPDPDWNDRKPDKDNIEKIVLDSLNHWLHDDSQVVCGDTAKVFPPTDVSPCVIIRVQDPPPPLDHPVVRDLLPLAPMKDDCEG